MILQILAWCGAFFIGFVVKGQMNHDFALRIEVNPCVIEITIGNAINNPTLAISRLRKEYDSIREIGNYAAHRVLYNTRKKDIDNIKQTYRVCLEELYYKAGLLK